MKIITIAGQPLAGKDEAAKYIASKGFASISTGDIIREDMTKLGIPLDRAHMSAFSSRRRAEVGKHYPVDRAADMIKGDTVVSGPRNTAEINAFKKRFGAEFHLVAID